MSARANLATAHANITGKYNRLQVETFVIAQYVTKRNSREDRAANRLQANSLRVVDIAGADGRPGCKLCCEYGLFQEMRPTSAPAGASAAIQKEKGERSLSKSGNLGS